jgi:hypothetical protein
VFTYSTDALVPINGTTLAFFGANAIASFEGITTLAGTGTGELPSQWDPGVSLLAVLERLQLLVVWTKGMLCSTLC